MQRMLPGQQRDSFNEFVSPLMISYMIIWQGNSTSQAVARGLSCAEAVFHAHITIVVPVGTLAIECPSISLCQSEVKKPTARDKVDSQETS